MPSLIAILLLGLLALGALLGGLRISRQGERLVVFRLGRFHRVLRPGLHWTLPGIDVVARVPLDAAIPDWQGLAEAELSERLRQLAVRGQLFRADF